MEVVVGVEPCCRAATLNRVTTYAAADFFQERHQHGGQSKSSTALVPTCSSRPSAVSWQCGCVMTSALLVGMSILS